MSWHWALPIIESLQRHILRVLLESEWGVEKVEARRLMTVAGFRSSLPEIGVGLGFDNRRGYIGSRECGVHKMHGFQAFREVN